MWWQQSTWYSAVMRIAILADIHGNVLALEAVLADLKHRKVDQFVNLGDCVSGPLWPRETAELLRQLNWPTVRGNHDRWVTDWSPENHYPSDAFAFQALDSSQLYVAASLAADARTWQRSLCLPWPSR